MQKLEREVNHGFQMVGLWEQVNQVRLVDAVAGFDQHS